MLTEVKLAHPVYAAHPAHLPLAKPFGAVQACHGTGVAGGDGALIQETTPCMGLVPVPVQGGAFWLVTRLESPLASYRGAGKAQSSLSPSAERSRGPWSQRSLVSPGHNPTSCPLVNIFPWGRAVTSSLLRWQERPKLEQGRGWRDGDAASGFVHSCGEIFFLLSMGISLSPTGAVASHPAPGPLQEQPGSGIPPNPYETAAGGSETPFTVPLPGCTTPLLSTSHIPGLKREG